MKLAYILVFICVLALAAGQLIFKYVGNRIVDLSWRDLPAHPDIAAVFALGLLLYGATTVLWIMALRDLPLSRAYMFMSLAFILVPLAASAVFGEILTARFMAGALLIVAGIVVSAS